MSQNQYRKVEGMLYSHYKRKNRINSLKSRLVRITMRIERFRRDIKDCNIELGETMKAIDYSKDAGGGGGSASSIERELERVVDNILREIEYSIKEKHKTRNKIRRLEKDIDDVEVLLEDFSEEELQIIELRYSDKMSDKVIGDRLSMSRPTVQRRKMYIINYLIEKL